MMEEVMIADLKPPNVMGEAKVNAGYLAQLEWKAAQLDAANKTIERLRADIRDAPCLRATLGQVGSAIRNQETGLCMDCIAECWKRKALEGSDG
jgi:hypothetical protein